MMPMAALSMNPKKRRRNKSKTQFQSTLLDLKKEVRAMDLIR